MAGVAMMLGIEGRNPARTWQRYENGASEPPLTIIAKMEMISEGVVNTTSWMQVRQAHLARRQVMA
ncbi:hypothetical protein ASF70_18800 [Rhizobium sp. Leaf321]|nr:hypothetical protein ASF70_18800 [Rhizobium sp. Leaf321]